MTTAFNEPAIGRHSHRGGPSPRVNLAVGGLHALIFLNLMQIAAGLAGIEPSPPSDVLPLIAAITALGFATVPLVRNGERSGWWLGLAFCATSLVGMGPHKLLVDDASSIAPLALTGFAFEVLFVVLAVRELRVDGSSAA